MLVPLAAATALVLGLAQAGSGASHPGGWFCSGSSQTTIFDNWTTGDVSNGASAPQLDTGGQAYCVDEIDTYHYNGGTGDPAGGTIGLTPVGGALAGQGGPWPVTVSDGGGPSANWTATPSTPSDPVVIQGTYACDDSNQSTWSYDAATTKTPGGFCRVLGRAATQDTTAPTVTLSSPAGGSIVNPSTAATVHVTDDTGATVVEVQASSDGGTTWSTAGSTSVSPTTDGDVAVTLDNVPADGSDYALRAVATDRAGNAGTSAAVSGITIDRGPQIAVACDPGPDPCGSGWSKDPVTVTLSATSAFGPPQIEYTTDGTDPSGLTGIPYDLPFTVSTEGHTAVAVVATDANGVSATTAESVLIDETAPPAPTLELASRDTGHALEALTQDGSSATIYFNPGSDGSFDMRVPPTDDPLSGVASASFPGDLGTGGWTGSASGPDATYAWTAGAGIPNGFAVASTDNAGNAGAATSVLFQADATPPIGGISCVPASCVSSTGPVQVTIDATDDGSGVDQVRYTTDGSDPSTGTIGTTFEVRSDLTVRAWAVDRVGNGGEIATAGVTGAAPAGFTVDSVADTHDASPGDGFCADSAGACTLRAAVEETNVDAGSRTIDVPAGTYALTSGALVVSNGTAIAGAGARTTTVTGSSSDRVFDVTATADGATISGLTLTGGTATASNGYFGGDVRNAGSLTLLEDAITAGSASSGGGVSNAGGTLLIDRSTVSGNSALDGGGDSGGVQNWGDGTNHGALTIENSTISGNQARLGGGVFSWNDAANTTLIEDSTIAGNQGGDRGIGGLGAGDGTISVRNTIVSGNTDGGAESNCGAGGIVSLGYNLEWGIDCGFTSGGDVQDADPLLGPLADNGGPTDTMLPGAGSPAIDAGDGGSCPSQDQRGQSRPQGARCDIGAVEQAPAVTTPSSWNLPADFRTPPDNSNPNLDSAGEPVWSFAEGPILTPADPATYTLLPTFANPCANVYDWVSGTPNLGAPAVFDNTNPGALTCGPVTEPGNTFGMHPDPTRNTLTGWTAPVSGTFAVSGSFADIDAACGDGVDWFVDLNGTQLASGGFGNGGSQSFDLGNVTVNAGETLWFAVNAGPAQNFVCDSTAFTVTIGPGGAGGGSSAPGDVYVDSDYAGLDSGSTVTAPSGQTLTVGTDAFGTLFAAAQAVNQNAGSGATGTTIHVDAGTYNETESTIYLDEPGERLVGAGRDVTHVDVYQLAVDSTDQVVQGLDLAGPGTWTTAACTNCQRPIVRLGGDGVDGNGGDVPQNALIVGNRVSGGKIGIAFSGGESASFPASGSEARANEVLHNAIGVQIDTGSHNLVDDNDIHDNGDASKSVSPQASILIVHNSHNGAATGNVVRNNAIARSVNHGISVRTPGNTVADNTITDSGTSYPAFVEPSGIEIVGASGSNADDNVVSGNTITGSAFAGIKVGSETQGNQLTGNTISGTLNGAADGGTGDTSAGGSGIFITSYGAQNTSITGNTLGPNTGSGIRQAYTGGLSTGTVASGNSIVGNALGGVVNDDDQTTLDARGNWWGSPDGPSGAGPGHGDAVTSGVLYDPWLTSPPCSGPCPTTPQIAASLDFDYVNLTGFAPNQAITLTIGSTSIPDVQTDASGYVQVERSTTGIDLVPGMTITASDGTSTDSLTLANVHISSVDVPSGAVSGTADLNTPVQVFDHVSSSPTIKAELDTTSDGNGNWSVSFGAGGIAVGDGVFADVVDAQGNRTRADSIVQAPHLTASVNEGWIDLEGWLPGSTVSLTIDGADAGSAIVDTQGRAFVPSPPNGNLLAPGVEVDASNGIQSVTAFLQTMSFDSIDLATGIAHGRGPNESQIQVDLNSPSGGPPIDSVTTSASPVDGSWTADFSAHAPLTRPVSANATVFDSAGNGTAAGIYLVGPGVIGNLTYDGVHLSGWTPHETVHVTIDGGAPHDVLVDGNGNGDLARAVHGVDLVPGTTISATDGTTTQTVTLAQLSVDSIDTSADTVSGTASPGASVNVNLNRPMLRTNLGNLNVTASASGHWTADFSGYVDITVPVAANAFVGDGHGNGTNANDTLQIEQIDASLTNGQINLWNWPANDVVTVHVNGGPGIPVSVNADGNGGVDSSVTGLTLHVGDTITAGDGTLSKSLTLVDVGVDSVDSSTGVAGGHAPAGPVQVCVDNGGCVQVTAGSAGTWTADLVGVGLLGPGAIVRAQVTDADYDLTEADFVFAPDTTIDSNTSVYGGDGMRFAFSSPAGSYGITFVCAIDGAQPQPCTSPYTAFAAAGSHTFSVAAVQGTTADPTPATFTWTAAPPAPGSTIARIDVSSGSPADSFDTGVANTVTGAQVLDATCARLYDYPDQPVPAGIQVQPEVATALPSISSDGLTYTITVRSGFSFADGSAVTAQSFADALTRTKALGRNPEFGDVVSATAAGDVLTITLSKADGDLVARLADPGACPVPAGTPATASVTSEPGSGPYTIQSVAADRVVLVRNPHYTGGRPSGFAELDLDLNVDPKQGELRVLDGTSDYLLGGPPTADVASLLQNHPGQLLSSPENGVQLVTLNTASGPFSNVNLRKAVNFAVDRATLAQISNGNALGGPATDQLLAPGALGYQDWSIYPLSGPDLATAQADAAAAGVDTTHRVAVTLYTTAGNPTRLAMAQEIRTDLAAIGVDVQIVGAPTNQFFGQILPSGSFDMALFAWLNSPDPGSFLPDILRSGSADNFGRLSDPTLDSRLDAAQAATPPSRYDQFSTIDRDAMTNDAPSIPINNPTSRDLFSTRITAGSRIYNPGLYGIDLAALGTGLVVTNTSASGPGSLAQAITDANARPGADTITFNIPGSGVHTIALSSPLPAITDPLTIDGYSQPGASANTLAVGDNAKIEVELHAAPGISGSGLDIQAPNTTVRGLDVSGGFLYGIAVDGNATNVTIAGDFVGTDPTGTISQTQAQYGIAIRGVSGVTVGGANAADRNVVSGVVGAAGAKGAGVAIALGAQNVTVTGNYVGTDPTGAKAVPNAVGVIFPSSATSVTVGHNVIAGNSGDGIYLQQGGTLTPVSGVTIAANAIGVAADGTQLGNGGDGIDIQPGVTGMQITGNEIAWSGQDGIALLSSPTQPATHVTILSNSIHDDTGLGIDLQGGANDGQVAPVVQAASATGVSGALTGGAPNTNYTLEIFANDSCNASGAGEGQTLALSAGFVTDASGNAAWSLETSAIPAGAIVTATVTSSQTGDTSPFSTCFGTTSAVQNVVFTVDQSSASAGAAAFPLDGLPPQLFTQLATGDPSSAPIPSAPIPSAAVGAAPIPSAPIPSAPIPSAPIPSAPIPSAPIPSAPIPSAPIPSAGLAGLPIPSADVSNPLDAILLSSLPGLDVTQMFAGTLLAGELPQQLTLGDVYRTPTAYAYLVNNYSAADLQLGQTFLRGVRTLSYLLGGKTLDHITLPGGQSWQDALTTAGGSYANVDLTNTTVIGLDIMHQLGSLDLGHLTVGDLSGGLSDTLVGNAYLARIAFQETTMATIPTASVPGLATCAPTACPTIGDAAAQHAISADSSVTLGSLGHLIDGVTLNELVVALTPPDALPWEQESFVGWQGFSSTVQQLGYHLDFDVSCPSPATVTVRVTLPFGFLYVPGSTTIKQGVLATLSGTAYEPSLDPKTGATWSNVPTVVCTSGTQHIRLSFKGEPGFKLGASPSSATINAGTAGSGKITGAPVLVTRNWSNALSRSSEPTVAADTIVLSHIDRAGGTNYFRFPEQGRGKVVTIYMKPPAGTDYDLYVVRPAPDSLLASPIPSAPIPSAPIPSAPIPSAPIPSADTSVNTSTDNPPPELLDDGPLPSGQVSVDSITRGDGVESVTFRQAGTTGYDEIAVAGYNGAFSSQPFELRMHVSDPAPLPSSCPVRAFTNGAPTQAGQLPVGHLPSDTQAVALVNVGRMNAMYGPSATSSMLQSLNQVMGMVHGQVLQVDGDAGVFAAAQAWDASPCSVDAANAYVKAINALVGRYHYDSSTGANLLPSLQSITLVGADEQLPFARVADFVPTSSEFDNTGALAFLTNGNSVDDATFAAAAQGFVLTDDAYGAFHTRTLFGHEFFLPEVAVGRLVETPQEIRGQLDQFVTAGGKLDPTTGFVTGYDFMADGAKAVDDALASRITGGNTLLENTWHKSDLQPLLDGTAQAAKIDAWNAHYDFYRLMPAVYGGASDLLTTGLLPSPVANPLYTGSIFFTMGCHAGESIPDTLTPDTTRRLDWAQAYSQQGAAVFVGNTGYGYGDTASVALSERLMTLFAGHLAYNGDVGVKFMQSKNDYFASMGAYGPFDEKAVEEATFYGLPFWQLNSPSEPTPTPPGPLSPSTGSLQTAPLTIAPTLTKVAEARGTFWKGGAGTVFVPGRSVQPLETRDVTQPGTGLVAHGFFPSALVTDDSNHNLNLYFAKPMIDLAAHEPEPRVTSDVFPASPVKVAQTDYLGARHSTVEVIAGQSRPGSSPTLQNERLYTSVSGVVTYAPASVTDYAPPQFQQTGALVVNGSAKIFATVSDDSSAGVIAVRAFFSTGGAWRFVDLQPVAGVADAWSATTTVDSAKLEVGFVAEDAAGNTGWMTGKGILVDSYTATPPAPTIVIDQPLDGGTYTLGQSAPSSYSCSGPAGIAGCAGPAPSGSPIDTSTVGTKPFSVTATPLLGNPTSKSVSYHVVYNFGGFQAPIVATTTNIVKAGSSVPVKFSLHGSFGLGILAPGYPQSGPVPCGGGTVDLGDQTSTAGNSGLQYDASSDTYTYVWKTQKAWAGCRQLLLVLNDGVVHRATFQFK